MNMYDWADLIELKGKDIASRIRKDGSDDIARGRIRTALRAFREDLLHADKSLSPDYLIRRSEEYDGRQKEE